MKKFFALLVSLLLVSAAPLTVLAEETDMIKPFEGLVTDVFEDGFLMEDLELGQLQVNTGDNTVFDGLLSIQPIEPGMYVIVDHNGMVTRSLPPQVYGLRVGCYTLNGTADQITEEGVLLTGDPIFGEVFVQMTPTMANVCLGAPMLVYYDGVITMSLPGKVNARYVVVPELTGVVSDKDGAGFTLTDADGNTYRILTSDSLLVGHLAEAVEAEAVPEEAQPEEALTGAELKEAAETVADEAITEADEVITDAESEAAENEVVTDVEIEAVAADSAEAEQPAEDSALPAIAWGDGDTVTVYHQGPIDAQPGSDLTALGLLVHH